jgi:chromosome partitioning protein
MRAVIDEKDIPDGYGIIHHAEGVDLLPANIELSGIETGLVNTMSREHVLKEYIGTIRKDYDYILIDCMPSLGMLTINALVASDSLVIPSQPNFLSAKGLNLLLNSVSRVRRTINPRLRIDGILLTMVDSRTNNARDIIASLRNTIGQNIHVFDTEIPHSVRAAECSLTGQSIYAYDRNGKVAQAYEEFTKEVAEIEKGAANRSRNDRVR